MDGPIACISVTDIFLWFLAIPIGDPNFVEMKCEFRMHAIYVLSQTVDCSLEETEASLQRDLFLKAACHFRSTVLFIVWSRSEQCLHAIAKGHHQLLAGSGLTRTSS
jgi:hypothetical protein